MTSNTLPVLGSMHMSLKKTLLTAAFEHFFLLLEANNVSLYVHAHYFSLVVFLKLQLQGAGVHGA